MNILQRLLLITLILVTALFTVTIVLYDIIAVPGFQELEKNYATDTDEMLSFVLDELITEIDRSVKDWAAWDDTYYFVKGQNEGFIEDNLMDATFDNLELNSIIIANDDEEIVFEKYYDYHSDEELELFEEERDDINRYVFSFGDNVSVSGIVAIGENLVIFSGRRITDSFDELSSDHYLIFSKFIDQQALQKISSHTGGDTYFERTDIPINQLYGNEKTITPGKTYYRYIDKEHIEVLSQIGDTNGDPVAVAHVSIYRGEFVRNEQRFMQFMIILLVFICGMGGIWFWINHKYIFSRIRKMHKVVLGITQSQDLSKKLDAKGDDEIATLGRSFNSLTEQLSKERSELIEKNAQLENMNDELRKLDELKDDFLSNVSHEIRTPLTGISSFSQLLGEGTLGPLTEDQKEGVKIISDSTIELNKIVNDLLDISKFESGKMRLDLKEIDVNILIDEEIAKAKPQIEMIGARLDIAKVVNPNICRADPLRIKQVIRNLLSNCIKYRSERPLVITIKSYQEQQDGFCIIEINDNGMGISKENLKHLFEKFYQVDQSMSRKVGGSGLGLAIVKRIVESHRGDIKTHSEIGKGTCFTIRIPMSQAENPTQETSA